MGTLILRYDAQPAPMIGAYYDVDAHQPVIGLVNELPSLNICMGRVWDLQMLEPYLHFQLQGISPYNQLFNLDLQMKLMNRFYNSTLDKKNEMQGISLISLSFTYKVWVNKLTNVISNNCTHFNTNKT